ncbi:iron-siderophore ABC transporter substrate-binding protein [Prauserella cavernicola]|uniref:Iron-siderophore ABC transporter substrate-binding protein n=1 Tax=Prauserella cavernicola TaxID=2800127 RepID=A0A934V5M7_9PSEU|nr:iron-siderophore ABC transporter substrate-binding protein [Prauserella cavernicola]MBK1786672.1 iron-siderophore ABC transporter substrate-binding protein [Prauserella cavernicola]
MRRAVSPVRRVLAGSLAGALVALAGCTTGGGEAQDDAQANTGTGFPVTIGTAFGDVTIEQAPQRVVALGWSDAEVALALGVEPVGVADWLDVGGDGLGPWVEQDYTNSPAQLGTLEVNMEKVAELGPDLILDTRASGDQARYDRLSELGVPVVSIPEGGENYFTDWEQQLDLIGKALGKQDQAVQLRDDLEAKFDQAVADHPEFEGATTVIAARSSEAWGAYVSGSNRITFMERLGFTNSPQVQELVDQSATGFSVPISDERFDLLDADLTIATPVGVEPSTISDDPLYQSIPSVREGRSVLFTDKSISRSFASASVLGTSYALDVTVPLFADALAS